MSNIQQIPLVPGHAAILKKCQSAFCHAVKAKFNCMAILHNMEEAGSFGSNSGVLRAEKRYSTKLSNRVEISIWKDDLTRHQVYAVVNAANEKLNHTGGLAQALSDAGGPMIQKWSDDIIQRVQRVKTGDAVLTPAGNLPCKYIIHAVGPCLAPNPNKKDIDRATPFLYNAIFRILEIAVIHNISSVAIPALSSGLFHFPRDLCADIIIKAIKQFHDLNGFQGKNLEIHLVNNDEPTVQEMERATRAILGPPSISAVDLYSGALHLKTWSKSQVYNAMATSFASAAKETTANETPTVEFHSVSKEAEREAKVWAFNMLKQSDNMTIRNNHVIYLDQRDHENMLSLQAKFRVHIKKFLRSGNGGITITGSPSDVSCAAIEVESMLCKAQEDFTEAEENYILYSVVRWSCEDEPWIQTPEISAVLEKAYLAGSKEITFSNHKVRFKSMVLIDDNGGFSAVKRTCLLDPFEPLTNSFYARTPVSSKDYLDKEGRRTLEAFGFRIVKVEKLENNALKQLFDKNEQRMKDKPRRLYQRVSAQFCDLICRVGFQKEFAPPAGNTNVKTLRIIIRFLCSFLKAFLVKGAEGVSPSKEQEHEQYIYIIQARVLTGKSTDGFPHSILSPNKKQAPLNRYDCLSDRGHVIFSSQQALPECLIICDKLTAV
ncbi:protein mono-ADP-ribosyltransferase PARP9-like [Ctenopharyngodon idella]|uniref:protein mono-ADP-ribosyltransferase PARP9-like n=1 Tax=Ctenopharyngodon idella TaxID=7959 RepID=UPI0022311083|nr:protein mono-ADP-ribosyltransferase PARP9-like [Ctenopharyngodon idella]XP_051762276.1 protein mono-ADP-ribosyltransferase PARP9-like [Ctenopharyngodon idella]